MFFLRTRDPHCFVCLLCLWNDTLYLGCRSVLNKDSLISLLLHINIFINPKPQNLQTKPDSFGGHKILTADIVVVLYVSKMGKYFYMKALISAGWNTVGSLMKAALSWHQLWSPTHLICKSWTWVRTICRNQEWSCCLMPGIVHTAD